VTHCENCDVDVAMVTEITPQGLTEKCPKCQFKPKRVEAARPATLPERKVLTPVVMTSINGSLVDHVRARLASVEVELERHAALKQERSQLRAMLKAAERKR
jgi:hypothetical protein